MNDLRTWECAVRATLRPGNTPREPVAFTVSPVPHNGHVGRIGEKLLEQMGCHSILHQGHGRLLKPLCRLRDRARLKETVRIPVALHCHATTGMSTAAIVKAVGGRTRLTRIRLSRRMSNDVWDFRYESIVTITRKERITRYRTQPAGHRRDRRLLAAGTPENTRSSKEH